MKKKCRTLIIGANSGIARALVNHIAQEENHSLILVSREKFEGKIMHDNKVQSIVIKDYSTQSILAATNEIQMTPDSPLERVFICQGILHTDSIKPEKRLEDVEANAFTQVMTANALSPMLWLKTLIPILAGKHQCFITVLSARVGSISDNRLGGWYSYRASKAALNMLLKTVSIECNQRAKNIKLLSFHPGTTDTQLSKPFQKNVPPGKLFTSEFVAKQLIEIVDNLEIDGELSFLDWQGKHLEW